MIIEGCDDINAYTLEGVAKQQKGIKVIGYNEKKVGGWDSLQKKDDSIINSKTSKKQENTSIQMSSNFYQKFCLSKQCSALPEFSQLSSNALPKYSLRGL